MENDNRIISEAALQNLGFNNGVGVADTISALTDAGGYDNTVVGSTAFAGKMVFAGQLAIATAIMRLAQAVERMCEVQSGVR